MTLECLGYDDFFESYREGRNLDLSEVGRVIAQHKERYFVRTIQRECEAEIIGNLRFSAMSRADFPAVGDWVSISEYDENKVLIHSVFPRKTIIERQAVGKQGEKQIIATNIDYALIVQAVDRDFNINRIERYLTICHSSDVIPVIVLNKIDLIDEGELSELISNIRERIKQVPVITISNQTRVGIEKLKGNIIKGRTYCLLGSSGVGKSTLLNTLSGRQVMKTNKISTSTNKGRHITSHRELLVLDTGGILIDNPGMREVGVADSLDGLEITFDAITELSKDCKYKNCTHTSENACAVLIAIERGEIEESAYENYRKLEQENEHFESTVAERRKKDKDLGKIIKQYKSTKNSNEN